MITGYSINDNILYLYISKKYEFSKELNDPNSLKVLSKDFININNIPFSGEDVCFVVDGLITNKISINNKLVDNYVVHLKDKDTDFEITMREYLLSVLFSYYNEFLSSEVLKAICVLYNTYIFKMIDSNIPIDVNDAFYKYKENDYSLILDKLNETIDSVDGYYLTYNKEYILPFIHYSNSGKTNTNKLYPYLSSVNSLWDITSTNYIRVNDYNYKDISDILHIKIDSKSKIKLINSGHSLKIDYKCFSIDELKSLLNLPSNNISIIIDKDKLRFITRGCGNSLGLSLYGAKYMELNGNNFIQILNYYFPKCRLNKRTFK